MALGQVWKHAEKRLAFEGKNVWPGQTRSTKVHRGNADSGKRPFTPTEVRKLLEQRPTLALDAANSLRWVVHIGAYSGLRLEEIASLTISDVQLADGLHYFKVTKSKSKAGVRIVPIHSEVLAAGFLAYRDALKDGSLWPSLKARRLDGKRGRRTTKLFANMRRGLGLVDIDTVTGTTALTFTACGVAQLQP
jgi:integrase